MFSIVCLKAYPLLAWVVLNRLVKLRLRTCDQISSPEYKLSLPNLKLSSCLAVLVVVYIFQTQTDGLGKGSPPERER
jgi:hypothetical protein